MSPATATDESWRDGARPASETKKATFSSEAAAAGWLWVDLDAPKGAVRGRLGLFVEGAIERALDARGAPPSNAAIRCDREVTVADQLQRARVSGAPGIALWFASLEGIVDPENALDANDSAALRFWLGAAERSPVMVAFAPGNERIGVYVEPETLASILARAAANFPEQTEETYGATSSSETAVEDDHATSQGEALDGPVTDEDSGDPETGLAESARAMAAALGDDGDTDWLREALIELSTPPPAHVAAPAVAMDETRRNAPRDRPALAPPALPRLDLRFADDMADESPPELDHETRRKLEAHGRELDAAIGPKPLAVVERLFTNAYVPVRRALDRGVDLPALRETADEWAGAFERSYIDGFDALRVRTKRPPMVVDVPDIALRVARLHGARSTQLLLVDSMRYDLGDAVNDRIRTLVGQRAACAERFLLWAALPTVTGTQIELIGRGASGLKDVCTGVSEDLVVARGRKASVIRRLKTGHRELLKLDIVAARLAEPGGAEPGRFDETADEVAQRIVAHFEGLQPRTLVMVFGDHGFRVGERGENMPRIREGGASPEEVLVPAFAWLVGAVH